MSKQPNIIKILLIEDDPGDAYYIEELLSAVAGCPFEITCAEKLSKALKHLSEEKFDIILSDLSLPDAQGLDTFHKIHAQAPETPIVLITGLDDGELASKLVHEGAQDYLVKGQIDANILVRCIRYSIERKNIEEALRESEEKFRTLVEMVPHAVYECDTKGIITIANSAYTKITGYSNQELIGISVWTLMESGPQKDSLPAYLRQLVQEQPIPTPYIGTNITKDGRIIDVQVDWTYKRDENGRVIGFVCILADITERKQAEEALKQSEAKYHKLIETANDAIFIADVQTGKIIDVNNSAEKLIGLPAKKIIGMHQSQLHPKEEAEHYAKLFQEHVQTGGDIATDIFVVHKDGHKIPVEISASTTTVGGKKIIQGIFRDVTERKQIEDAIWSVATGTAEVTGENYFCSLVQHLAKVMGVRYVFIGEFVPSDKERIQTLAVWAGDKVAENFEYDLAGTPCANVVQTRTCSYPKGVQKLFPTDHLLVEMGIESYLGVPLIDSSKNRLGLLVAMDDKSMEHLTFAEPMMAIFATRIVTEIERKRADELLKSSEARYHDLYDNAPDMAASVDAKTAKILQCNQTLARATGYTKEEIIGRPIFDMYHPTCLEGANKAFEAFVTTGKVHNAELALKRKDGSKIEVSLNVSAVYDEEGNILHSRSVWRDITERKRTEEELRASEEKFKNIFDNANIMIWGCYADGKIKLFNKEAERIMGYSREEIFGKENLLLHPPEEREEIIAGFANHRDGELKRDLELGVYTKEGKRLKGLLAQATFKDASGEDFYVALTQDITERKLVEEEKEKLLHDVGERVKELRCLYGLSKLEQKQDLTLEEILKKTVDLLPPGWHYPDITCAKIVFKDRRFKTDNFKRTEWEQSTDIKMDGKKVGSVIVCYLQEKLELDEGPFLKEERELIEAIAERLGNVAERKRAEEELQESEKELETRNRIAEVFLTTSGHEMYEEVLQVVLGAMKSKYGIFGYIDETGAMVCPSMTRDIWDKCSMGDKTIVFPTESWGGIWGRALKEKKTFYANGPFRVPEGHIPITRDMSTPILYQKELIGILQVANKETDYDEKDQRLLEGIARHVAPILHAKLQRDIEEKARKQAEAVLLLEKQRLDDVSTYANCGLLLLDEQTRVTYSNKLAEEWFGPSDQINGRYCWELFKLKNPEKECAGLKVLKTGETVLSESFTEILHGEKKFFYVVASPVKDEEGNVTQVTEIVVDITERKRVEDQLRNALENTQQRQKEVAGLLGGARAVLENHEFKDTARSIYDTCKGLIGAKAGYVALLSQDGTENEVLFLDSGGHTCTVDPSLTMPIRGLRGQAYHERKTVYDNDFSNSKWMKFIPKGHSDLNSVLFAPLVLEGRAMGLMGLANKPEGFTEHDVQIATAFAEIAAVALHNSRTLELLEDSEETFRKITVSAQDAILMMDNQGNISHWNKAAENTFGYLAKEVLGKELHMVLAPSHYHEAYEKGFKKFQRTGRGTVIGKTIELTALRKNGREVPIEMALSAVKLKGKWNAIGILRDITGRKLTQERIARDAEMLKKAYGDLQKANKRLDKANQDLKKLDELKSNFIATASHELRTPLTSIRSCAEMLYDKLDHMPQHVQTRFLHIIVNEADRLTRLINDTLDLQKMESEEKPLQKQPLDIAVVIKESIAIYRLAAKDKKVMLSAKMSDDLPQVMGDKDQLLQVLGNIIYNAIKFIPDGGTVTVSAAVEQNWLEISVTDNGIGMSEEQQVRVFDKFYRVQDKSLKTVQGAGLGLAIVKQIIDKHEGRIRLDSALGKGSTFTFSLPLKAQRGGEVVNR